MTLVFDRGALPADPVTHAMVIGCGRFPADANLDRKATAAGARAIMALLAEKSDQFVAPIWTIDCVLSDAGVAAEADTLGVELNDPGGATVAAKNTVVASATLAHATTAIKTWLKRLTQRPGDSAFFYMSTHGIADPVNALGVFEDVLVDEFQKWGASINATTLAGGLATLQIGRAWVFLDACQDIIQELLGAPTGVPGYSPIHYGVEQATHARKSVAIVGSHFGDKGWAPDDGSPSFFTQTLLEGLCCSCVEPVQGLGWTVTGKQLIFGLPVLSAVMGTDADCEPLTRFNESGVGLLKVSDPQIHVALTTETKMHLEAAKVEVICDDDGVAPIVKPSGHLDENGLIWRFKVGAHKRRSYSVSASFESGGLAYSSNSFDPDPPAQRVELKRML
jgi:hypothetical protein